MQRLFTTLTHLVVPLAAFLTFMLQPVIGKLLLPVYGGSAGTWLTISMFFQAALLAGYALAWKGLEKHRTILPKLLACLAVLAAFSLRLPTWTFPRLPEWPGVLAALSVSILPAVLLTTSSGLILQGWVQHRRGRVPFYLYAISNVGSAIALLVYPFFIEPSIGLAAQILILKILLWILAAALLVLCWLERKHTSASSTAPVDEPEELPQGAAGAWFLLSFATCTLMLGAIPILGAEYGSNPFTWLLPLGIYLVSFSITFSGWWPPALNYVSMVTLSLALVGYMQTKGIGPTFLSDWARLWLALMVLAGCLGAQGFLYQLRPARRSSFFYLVIAAGGLASGVFVSAVAPFLLDRNLEFTAAGAFILVFLVLQLLGKAEPIARYSLVLMIIAPSAWFGCAQIINERKDDARTEYYRNHYGTLVLRRHDNRLSLSNESTLHGEQVLDKKFRRLATTYYTRGSAVGIIMEALQTAQPSLRVGVVGLGTGTLAAYGRKGDRFVFWDINPLSIKLAREKFSFVRDCPATVEIHQTDGRLGLAASRDSFDLVVLDAFSGDSIPAHLVTREALATYLARLSHGVLLVHISNRHLDLFPVIAAGARHAGWKCMYVNSTPQPSAKLTLLANGSSYAVVYPAARQAEVEHWFESTKKNPDFDFVVENEPAGPEINWTDDRSAITDLLSWDSLLHR